MAPGASYSGGVKTVGEANPAGDDRHIMVCLWYARGQKQARRMTGYPRAGPRARTISVKTLATACRVTSTRSYWKGPTRLPGSSPAARTSSSHASATAAGQYKVSQVC
jgi:hypothetical protein